MKVVAAVLADFVQGPNGLPSQLRAPLNGQPTLTHTLQRLARVEGLAACCLFVSPRDNAVAADALRASGTAERIDLLPLDTAPRSRRTLITAARKWSLESWRGGLMGTTWFDEFAEPHALALLINHYGCDAVFCFDGHQPALDPALATAMLNHLREHALEVKMVFTQAPPGLAGIIICRDALQDYLDLNIPVGLLLSYRPELAQPDAITHSICCPVPPEVAQTAARLTGDTRRSRELLESAFADLGPDAGASELCRWLAQPGHDRAGALPIEIELELTTRDPFPDSTLRPRGARVPLRELSDFAALERVARELAQYDDRLVMLGGHGDPLQHPRFADACHLLREAGVYGLGVTTPLFDLPDQSFDALFACKVDVVEVLLDAHTSETYRRVHGRDGFERVVGNIDRLDRARREREAPQPIVTCCLTRCAATISELEAFYDGWLRRLGTAVIRGYNSYSGVLPVDSLLSTTPAVRGPCLRLSTRLALLADGVVPLCAQDIEGKTRLGDWTADSLRTIWGGSRITGARESHARGTLEALPICQACDQWSRP